MESITLPQEEEAGFIVSIFQEKEKKMKRRTGGKEKEKLIQHDDGDNDCDYEEEEETFKMAINQAPGAPFFNCLILNTARNRT